MPGSDYRERAMSECGCPHRADTGETFHWDGCREAPAWTDRVKAEKEAAREEDIVVRRMVNRQVHLPTCCDCAAVTTHDQAHKQGWILLKGHRLVCDSCQSHEWVQDVIQQERLVERAGKARRRGRPVSYL
jgi:hypothetical protein